jgi:hypothetical protein
VGRPLFGVAFLLVVLLLLAFCPAAFVLDALADLVLVAHARESCLQ